MRGKCTCACACTVVLPAQSARALHLHLHYMAWHGVAWDGIHGTTRLGRPSCLPPGVINRACTVPGPWRPCSPEIWNHRHHHHHQHRYLTRKPSSGCRVGGAQSSPPIAPRERLLGEQVLRTRYCPPLSQTRRHAGETWVLPALNPRARVTDQVTARILAQSPSLFVSGCRVATRRHSFNSLSTRQAPILGYPRRDTPAHCPGHVLVCQVIMMVPPCRGTRTLTRALQS